MKRSQKGLLRNVVLILLLMAIAYLCISDSEAMANMRNVIRQLMRKIF